MLGRDSFLSPLSDQEVEGREFKPGQRAHCRIRPYTALQWEEQREGKPAKTKVIPEQGKITGGAIYRQPTQFGAHLPPYPLPPGHNDVSRVPLPQKGPCGMVYAEGRAPGMTGKKTKVKVYFLQFLQIYMNIPKC